MNMPQKVQKSYPTAAGALSDCKKRFKNVPNRYVISCRSTGERGVDATSQMTEQWYTVSSPRKMVYRAMMGEPYVCPVPPAVAGNTQRVLC